MKTKLFLASLFIAAVANAENKTEKVKPLCEQEIVNVVYDQLGRYDETFSVVGYKVIYESLLTKLAVVRTSDEVEPRDVLVEVTEGKKSCKVVFKETIADGSVADIDEELVELAQEPKKISSNYTQITGIIKSSTNHEIDAAELGDVCLIEVAVKGAVNTALVTSQYDCDEASDRIAKGKTITVSLHKNDRVKDPKQLEAYKKALNVSLFVEVPFSQIK